VSQYRFYFILKILSANFESLDFCRLALPNIIKKKDSLEKFLNFYKSVVIHLIENGYNQDFEEETSTTEEIKALWNEIYSICLKILSNSMSLIYADNKEILINLTKNLEVATTDVKQAENSTISLNYLSTSENIKKLINDDSE